MRHTKNCLRGGNFVELSRFGSVSPLMTPNQNVFKHLARVTTTMTAIAPCSIVFENVVWGL